MNTYELRGDERRRRRRVAHTNGKISAKDAIMSQMTPSQTEMTLVDVGREDHDPKNVSPPHLFPKQPSQIKPASDLTPHAKQANKHYDK